MVGLARGTIHRYDSAVVFGVGPARHVTGLKYLGGGATPTNTSEGTSRRRLKVNCPFCFGILGWKSFLSVSSSYSRKRS